LVHTLYNSYKIEDIGVNKILQLTIKLLHKMLIIQFAF